jgi:hypothetical protein
VIPSSSLRRIDLTIHSRSTEAGCIFHHVQPKPNVDWNTFTVASVFVHKLLHEATLRKIRMIVKSIVFFHKLVEILSKIRESVFQIIIIYPHLGGGNRKKKNFSLHV